MNEILFRGKLIEDNSWICGYYYFGVVGETVSRMLNDKEHFILDGDKGMYYEVYPESVGQYIGKNDITDKKIFTGDIVNIGNDTEKYYEVFYNKEECAYQLKYFAGYIRGIYNNMKVVGNITDNPELYNEIGRK